MRSDGGRVRRVFRLTESLALIVTGLLKVSRDPTAGLLAGFAVLPAAAWLLPAGTVLLALAESAEWFGVQPRRRWHSLLREGGWLLAVSLVLYGVMLAPLARH